MIGLGKLFSNLINNDNIRNIRNIQFNIRNIRNIRNIQFNIRNIRIFHFNIEKKERL